MRCETIGDATLYCADYADIVPTLEAGMADAVITDPPYGVTANQWDSPLDLDKFWDCIMTCAKNNAVFAIFSQMPVVVDLIQSNRKHFKYDIIWHKNKPSGFLLSKERPLRIHEIIAIFYKSQPTYIQLSQEAIHRHQIMAISTTSSTWTIAGHGTPWRCYILQSLVRQCIPRKSQSAL